MIINDMTFSWSFSSCTEFVQQGRFFNSLHVFHFVSLQAKHGFDIRIGPVSFNSPALDKDMSLIWVGFRQGTYATIFKDFSGFSFF